MKVRKWKVTYDKVESGLGSPGCTCTIGEHTHYGYAEMAPTVENIRKYIAEHFPEEKIDERWWSVKEMISDSLEYGYFGITLMSRPNEEFIARGIGFLEI